jgi:hypothetical protein
MLPKNEHGDELIEGREAMLFFLDDEHNKGNG